MVVCGDRPALVEWNDCMRLGFKERAKQVVLVIGGFGFEEELRFWDVLIA